MDVEARKASAQERANPSNLYTVFCGARLNGKWNNGRINRDGQFSPLNRIICLEFYIYINGQLELEPLCRDKIM